MGTFLHDLAGLITGHGFKKTKMVPLRDFNLASDGSTLSTTLSTNPGWDNVDTNLTVLSWAATKVVAAAIAANVPMDYDESDDHLKIQLLAKVSGTTDTTKTLTAAAYKASAPTTDLAPDATAVLTDSFQWLEFDLSDNSLVGGDSIQLVITPDATATDAIEVQAVRIEYKSCMVYFDKADR